MESKAFNTVEGRLGIPTILDERDATGMTDVLCNPQCSAEHRLSHCCKKHPHSLTVPKWETWASQALRVSRTLLSLPIGVTLNWSKGRSEMLGSLLDALCGKRRTRKRDAPFNIILGHFYLYYHGHWLHRDVSFCNVLRLKEATVCAPFQAKEHFLEFFESEPDWLPLGTDTSKLLQTLGELYGRTKVTGMIMDGDQGMKWDDGDINEPKNVRQHISVGHFRGDLDNF